jgi:hypothetical protein
MVAMFTDVTFAFLVRMVTLVTTNIPVFALATRVSSVRCLLWLREHSKSVSLCGRLWALSHTCEKHLLAVFIITVRLHGTDRLPLTDFHKMLYWGAFFLISRADLRVSLAKTGQTYRVLYMRI